MLQGDRSAILLTFIKLPFSIKTFVFSIFKWPLKTGFTVHASHFTDKTIKEKRTFHYILKMVKLIFAAFFFYICDDFFIYAI